MALFTTCVVTITNDRRPWASSSCTSRSQSLVGSSTRSSESESTPCASFTVSVMPPLVTVWPTAADGAAVGVAEGGSFVRLHPPPRHESVARELPGDSTGCGVRPGSTSRATAAIIERRCARTTPRLEGSACTSSSTLVLLPLRQRFTTFGYRTVPRWRVRARWRKAAEGITSNVIGSHRTARTGTANSADRAPLSPAGGPPHPRSGRRGRRFKSCHPDQSNGLVRSPLRDFRARPFDHSGPDRHQKASRGPGAPVAHPSGRRHLGLAGSATGPRYGGCRDPTSWTTARDQH